MAEQTPREQSSFNTEDGLRCPRCECRHLPVWMTRHRGKRTIRIRICRNCGKRVYTVETVQVAD